MVFLLFLVPSGFWCTAGATEMSFANYIAEEKKTRKKKNSNDFTRLEETRFNILKWILHIYMLDLAPTQPTCWS